METSEKKEMAKKYCIDYLYNILFFFVNCQMH